MTPEERAREIAYSFDLDEFDWREDEPGNALRLINRRWLAEKIAATIRAAVEAERERCAQVAEEHAGPFGGVGRLILADKIAEAIRNTNAPAEPER
jgi:hypothetical protein